MRKVLAEKILILGIDGMDPRFTKKMLDEGKLPNIRKLVDAGAQREDLVMLGDMPTITPPMWATLATGALANTHGITCFWRQSLEALDELIYAFDSRDCKAEQLWNVFAEAGKKTLVWSWPSAAWPPSSDSPNLYVVDGTSPSPVNSTVATIDFEKLVIADESFKEVLFQPKVVVKNGAGCVLDSGDLESNDKGEGFTGTTLKNIELTFDDGEGAFEKGPVDVCNSPLKPATGWANAPEGAKEFSIVVYKGLIRRPALLIKNEQGVYDTIKVYKSKQADQPLVTLTEKDHTVHDVLDEIKVDDEVKTVNRSYRLLRLSEDASHVSLYVGPAMDISIDEMFHPRSLYGEIVENVGYPQANPQYGGIDPELVKKIILPMIDNAMTWQAKSINYLIEKHNIDVVFSHVHNVDCYGHFFMPRMQYRKSLDNDALAYQECLKLGYIDTDNYVGQFIHLLDEGWTILITSDHGLLVSEEEPIMLGDPFGINATIMDKLGYTVLVRDQQGNPTKEIDWSKTRAVASRGNHIWINLKGRNATGIVDPEEQYELETQIISDLYNYRDPETGKRVVSIALRNKDAAIIGMSGPDCGDILYWCEEGFNRVHGDSLSTYLGLCDTSVSPIFIAAGKGLKKGFKTERVIREVDFAPTVAVLGGVRMPAQCEGAPVYQIFEEEF